MQERPGFELPVLLLAAFRSMIEELHTRLADRGHPGARPIHGFALQAIGAEGATISEFGRRLGVSKQAAAKTAVSLERAGYIAREPHPHDRRAWMLTRTSRGTDMLELSAVIFEDLRQQWRDRLGPQRLLELERDLSTMANPAFVTSFADASGWLQ